MLSVLVISCSENEPYIEDKSDVEIIKKQFSLLNKSNVQYNILLTYDNNLDQIVDYDLSENFFTDNNINEQELRNLIDAEVNGVIFKNGDPGENDENDGELSPHAACIEWCNDEYTDSDGNKIPGRGSCKANCWVDTVIRVVDALVPGK